MGCREHEAERGLEGQHCQHCQHQHAPAPAPVSSIAMKMMNGDKRESKDELSLSLDKKEKKMSRADKVKLWKNIVLLDLAIFFYHSPMMTYTNLMSSLLSDEGQGVASESINAGIMMFGSLLLCTYGTKRWSSKRVILVACIVIIPYLLINFHVVWATIIPGSVLAGLGDCFITQAVSVYYSDLATYYSTHFDGQRESFLLKMFGLCGVVLQSGFILGNVLVWAILDTSQLWTFDNSTSSELERTDDVALCGRHFCPDSFSWHNHTIASPHKWRVYTLCGIFSAMGVLAVLVTLFLDDYSHVSAKCAPKLRDIVTETAQLLCHPHQILLVMLSAVIGMAEGFFFGDFTQAYVSCSIGISQVGLVMTCYGLVNGFSAACQETLSGWFGRIPVVTLGGSLLVSLMFVLLYWHPTGGSDDDRLVLYVVAAVWGMADGILSTHLSTLYGTLYEDRSQVAYSCQTFWYGVGLCVSFGYSYYLCVSVKIYILTGAILAAMISYYTLEFHIHATRTTKNLNLNTSVVDVDVDVDIDNNQSVRTISASISRLDM